eukprot:Sspe_Gene.52984::Locus_29321_Transcript_1_1_Confidence_1.000_Length_675::g.52984::m.52984
MALYRCDCSCRGPTACCCGCGGMFCCENCPHRRWTCCGQSACVCTAASILRRGGTGPSRRGYAEHPPLPTTHPPPTRYPLRPPRKQHSPPPSPTRETMIHEGPVEEDLPPPVRSLPKVLLGRVHHARGYVEDSQEPDESGGSMVQRASKAILREIGPGKGCKNQVRWTRWTRWTRTKWRWTGPWPFGLRSRRASLLTW